MRISRQLKAVAVFEVKRDERLVLIDLKVVGLKYSGKRGLGRYSRYFLYFDELAENLGIGDYLASKDVVLYYRSKTVLCRMYVGPSKTVRYVVLASFQPGVLSKIVTKLEENFWKKVFLLEIVRIRRPSVRA